ncbi:DUF1194 domain-containing protein [Chenggangzhangella methanolivorans]|uniref:DUF1194 domain-containing protein n=1 Tax=Chenggangzhangella methanolivorans TaxID=1437009 RepID=A0A9E6RJK5_9HYPH|nr:DUF1194 domain-containing protein [Chenggangzhangella methanolivorans]QZO02197.1 DUF1194 domain-containing protein [Chenggangzhangella methanolivorans]
MRRRIRFLSGLALAAAASLSPAAAADKSGVPVDLELVLAVDISYSMDAEEQEMQREGYRAAIVSRPVLEAIAQGMIGRIAVAYVEWAGAEEQRVVVPWTLIDGAESAAAFAEKLAAAPLRRAYRTSISGALVHSAKLFETSGFSGARKVVDISGDGPNNQGEPVELVRDEVLDRGITVNGLPLMLKRPSFAMMDVGDLDAYYRDCVIGGPGAFMVPVRSIAQFPDAVRTKLLMEIAGLAPDHPSIGPGGLASVPVAAERVRSDCTSGEQLWRERFGN